MKRIDQMLKQWLPVNTVVREEFRNIIIKYIQLKMDESFNDTRRIYERNPDSGTIRSREPMDYGNERMVNPAVNSVPDDGVCEGEYVHPTQEEIIAFNVRENKTIDMKAEERIYYIKGLIDNELTNTKNKIYVNIMKFEDNNKQNPQDIELGHTLVEVRKQIEEIIKEIENQL